MPHDPRRSSMSTQQPRPGWPVMVLAHNEERHIEACLDSIFAADPECQFDVFVMANGCSDATEEIVRQYANKRSQVRLVSIQLGDKCNAWNVFIHETVPVHCPDRDVYFFMDGDARAVPGSFSTMALALAEDDYAHAASAPPASGRNCARDREDHLITSRSLVANLYALRGVSSSACSAWACESRSSWKGTMACWGADQVGSRARAPGF